MSGYSEGGASQRSNVLKYYQPRILSAKSDIDANLETLRNRAGDLWMNSPIGSSAINTLARSVVGSGLRVFPRLNAQRLGISQEESEQISKQIQEEFKYWSKKCDYNRRNEFEDLQYIGYVSMLSQGDAFSVFRASGEKRYKLQIQLLEGNRVSNPQSEGLLPGTLTAEGRLPNGNRCVNGVEIDDYGRVIAYWISNKVPNELTSDMQTEWIRVKAFSNDIKNVLQLCTDVRAEQYRGIPYLSPVIETMKQMNKFSEAELTSAIIRTYFSIFFTGTPTGISGMSELMPSDEPVVDPTEYQLGPGTIGALPAGVGIQTVDSGKTFSSFDVFIKAMSEQIGAGLGIPREVLLKSFNSSYSASRAALLQYNEEVKMRRVWFIRDFCQPIYERFLDEAVFAGYLQLKGYDEEMQRERWRSAEWYGPTMGILDPKKEVEAAKMRMENGLSTHHKEAMEMSGLDYSEIKELEK